MATGIKDAAFGGDAQRVYLLEAVVFDPENRNHLTFSDDLSDTDGWTATGLTPTSSAKTDPDGTTLAWKLTNDNAGNGEYLSQILTGAPVNPGWVHVFSVQADSSNGTATVRLVESGGAAVFVPQVRIVSGAVTVTETVDKFTLTGLSNSAWTQVEVFYPEDNLTAALELQIYPGNSTTTTADVIHAWRPHLEKAAAANGLGFRSRGPRTTAATNGPDGADGQAVTVRAGTENYVTDPADSPANVVYREGLIRPYTQGVRGGGPGELIAGIATTAVGTAVLENASANWDHLNAYDWRGRSVKFYRGLPGALFSTFDTIYTGTSDGALADDNTFAIQLRDPLVELDKTAEFPKFGGFGQCVRLDGTGDYVECGEVPAAWILGDLTIEARVRSYTDATNQLFVAAYSGPDSGSDSSNQSWAVLLDPFDDFMRLSWSFSASRTQVLVSSPNSSIPSGELTDGEWHYCAFIRDASAKTVSLFWDNAIIHTETYSDNPSGGWNGKLRIGANFDQASPKPGDIDELRVWAVTRTEEQLVAGKNTPIEPSQYWDKGLRAYYRMDEGLETRTWGEVTNLPERRMNETYLSFDGSGNYEQIANHADIQHASDFTVEIRCCIPDAGGGTEWIGRKNEAWRLFFSGTTIQGSIYTTPAAAFATNETITYVPGEDGLVLVSLRWNQTTKELALLVDGANKSSSTLTGESINAATTDIFLAATAAATANTRLWVSELRIWNGLRTDAQILAAANTILSGDETNLVLWHTFDEARPKPTSLVGIEKVEGSNTDYGLATVYDRHHSTTNKKDSSNLSGTFYDTSGVLQGDARFVGTGEGYRDLEGLRKPYVAGWAHNIPLLLVDPLNNVYHSALGPIEEMTALREGGRDLELTELGGEDDVWDYDFRDFPDSCRTLLTTTWTDETADATDDTAHDGDVPFLHGTPGSNTTDDGIYIGLNSKFVGVDLWIYQTLGNVDAQDAGADVTLSWQFWNGEAFEDLSALFDGTDGMRLGGKNSWTRQISARAGEHGQYVKTEPSSGKYFNSVSKVRWSLPETWIKDSLDDIATAVGGIGSPSDSTDRWWIRLAATANATGYTTQPSVSAVWTLGVDAVVDLATGFVRLNSPPLYPITADVKGDNTGGTWLDTAAKIAKNMMERWGGWVSGDFAASFTTKGLDATVSAYTGTDDLSFADVLRPLFADTRSILVGDRDGKIDIVTIGDPTGAAVAAELIDDNDHILSLSVSRGASPASEIIYRYKQYYAEVSERDLSLLLPTEQRTDLLSRFRRHTHTFGLDSGTNYKEGEPQIVGGSISADSSSTTTISEAALWADMIGSDRRFYTVRIPFGVVEYTIGTLLGLRITRYNLWDGTTTVLDSKPAYVLSFEEDAGAGEATLVLWG